MNELGNTPADKDYKPSGIVNNLMDGATKAVQLPDGTFITEKLAKSMTKAQDAALKAFPGQQFIHDRCVFRFGYEQAEKDLGWISVKDKLPGPSEWVLACIEQHGHAQCLTLAVYSEETKEWHTDQWEDGEQETYYPDYWMPIPNTIKK